jgi:hypothetical protein
MGKTRSIACGLWFGACVFVLVRTLVVYSRADQDAWVAYVLFLGGLVALTFPAGIAVLALVVIPGSALAEGRFWWAWFTVQWMCFVAVGFSQWFIFVPRSFAAAARARSSSA